MSDKTDKIIGRTKQTAGSITGDDEMKYEGERQEDKGKAKEKLGSIVDKGRHVLDDVKHKIDRA